MKKTNWVASTVWALILVSMAIPAFADDTATPGTGTDPGTSGKGTCTGVMQCTGTDVIGPNGVSWSTQWCQGTTRREYMTVIHCHWDSNSTSRCSEFKNTCYLGSTFSGPGCTGTETPDSTDHDIDGCLNLGDTADPTDPGTGAN
ncbi:MAG: hypothetical protein BGO01_01685 [Armatimonadetes bacterium 55-13]|nr:hypothetical protein [Armatimonadota bacterium]OJU65652.1 MAG: hypothetical protein BGO01_01685 [Armatimonadetes bacterium 55-13]